MRCREFGGPSERQRGSIVHTLPAWLIERGGPRVVMGDNGLANDIQRLKEPVRGSGGT